MRGCREGPAPRPSGKHVSRFSGPLYGSGRVLSKIHATVRTVCEVTQIQAGTCPPFSAKLNVHLWRTVYVSGAETGCAAVVSTLPQMKGWRGCGSSPPPFQVTGCLLRKLSRIHPLLPSAFRLSHKRPPITTKLPRKNNSTPHANVPSTGNNRFQVARDSANAAISRSPSRPCVSLSNCSHCQNGAE